jgi:hypothetical protein
MGGVSADTDFMDWVEGNKLTKVVDLRVSRFDAFIARLGDTYLQKTWSQAKTQAMAADSLYAEIEGLRRDGSTGMILFDPSNPKLGWAAWEYQNDVESVFHRNKSLLVLARWASNKPFSRMFNDFIANRQRSQRGWDFKATYSLDHHLATTLGPQLLAVSQRMESGDDAWLDEMRQAGADLSRYAEKDDIVLSDKVNPSDMGAVEQDLTERAQDAIRWVAKNLGKLSQ